MSSRLRTRRIRPTGSSKRIRLAALALIAAAAAGAGATAWISEPGVQAALKAAPSAPAPAPAGASSQPLPVHTMAAAVRRIYPYSIVPGGAASREELAQAIKADKVVADHYSGFDVDKAQVVTVAKPRAVYVSYRKGDKVYWTSKKLMLAEGETLLSDGKNEMRTRCANRISDTPQLPVAPGEPSEAELDVPVAEEGSVQDIAAEMVEDVGFDGQPYQLRTFANGAGLAPGAEPATTGFQFAMNSAGPMPYPRYETGDVSRTVTSRDPGAADSPDAVITEPAPGTDSSSPGAPATPGTDSGTTGPGAPKPPTGGGDTSAPGPEPKPDLEQDPAPQPERDPTPFIPPPLGQPELPPEGIDQTGPADVPEPGTLWLGGLAGLAMLLLRRGARGRRG
ncbi:PEP-CTERM sorting domain-containing protein [Massilia sp. ST3]|uniref:PEP-CTERM sorting domain-containing protein n=1 Tax=Massilia sp. ST3 TaxID=2824903 RepID=UPI001B812208|nr:PEP-CTERM sorting domain-containing protein [Massilia sp. ST3]MBQ5949504.1 PEP-CTERM sorting domain-containing protein [Massilia sp. ST3]